MKENELSIIQPAVLLSAEICLVTITALLAIKYTASDTSAGWLLTPGILVAAAIFPTVIKKNRLSDIGLNFGSIKDSFIILGWTCLAIFPAMFCCLWLLKFYGAGLPLRPVLPQGQGWVSWVFYQVMYIAVAEEMFFRGYLQTNILRLINAPMTDRPRLKCLLSVIISSACFAAAHMILQGQIISVLTFLPALVFGWLFIRTKSLLAPILFHAIANVAYCAMAALLT